MTDHPHRHGTLAVAGRYETDTDGKVIRCARCAAPMPAGPWPMQRGWDALVSAHSPFTREWLLCPACVVEFMRWVTSEEESDNAED